MKRPLVAISVGNAPEQLELGFGEEHLAEALVRLARLLLRAGCDLAYGGDLRPVGFTQLLIELVRAESGEGEIAAKASRSGEQRRFVNFLPWPQHLALTVDLRARHLRICRYVCVDPPPPLSGGPLGAMVEGAAGLLRAPLALSRMRQAMAAGGIADMDGRKVQASAARIVLGGKVHGYSGLMPGIVEEVARTLLAGNAPVFLLGGFGGAAAALARSVLAGELLPELTLAVQRELDPALHERLKVLEGDSSASRFGAYDPRQCERALHQFCRAGVAGLAKQCRLKMAQAEVLLQSSDFETVRAVLGTVRWAEFGGKQPKAKAGVRKAAAVRGRGARKR